MAISENGHYAADQVYFQESNSKKGKFGRARGKVSLLKKNTETLRNEKKSENLQIPSFIFKEQSPEKI